MASLQCCRSEWGGDYWKPASLSASRGHASTHGGRTREDGWALVFLYSSVSYLVLSHFAPLLMSSAVNQLPGVSSASLSTLLVRPCVCLRGVNLSERAVELWSPVTEGTRQKSWRSVELACCDISQDLCVCVFFPHHTLCFGSVRDTALLDGCMSLTADKPFAGLLLQLNTSVSP